MEKRVGYNHKVIGLVSMDVFKAFDTLPHNLIILKLREYGADEGTSDLIKNYLSDRKQRVKLGDKYSSWQSISRGIPQGSILSQLLFNVFINDVSYIIKNSTLSTYADDPQIFSADNDPAKVEEAINTEINRQPTI